MTFQKLFFAGIAAIALAACGQKENADAPSSASSVEAADSDASSPLDSEYRLADASPLDVDALFALMNDDARPTYDRAEFDEKLGATVVYNLWFADNQDEEGVRVERAEFYGVDLEAIERIQNYQSDSVADDSDSAAEEQRFMIGDPEAANAPFEKVFDKVRFLNVASEGFVEDGEEMMFTIGGLEFDTLQIRQSGFESFGFSNMPAGVVNAVSFAGIYLKDFTLRTASDDEASLAFSAPDMRLVSIGGGKLDALIINGLEYEMAQTPESMAALEASLGPQAGLLINGPMGTFLAPENQRGVVKSLEWRGIDFSGLLAYGLRGEEPPVSETDLIDLGTLTASNMETFIGEKRLSLVKDATISAAEFTWLIPSKFRSDASGAVYDFTAYASDEDEELVAVLKEHGLDNVKGDGYVEWVWDPKKGTGDFDYVANMDGVADLSLAFGVTGLEHETMIAAEADGDSDALFDEAAFKKFTFNIEDEKALDAIFALAALQMGGTAEDLRLSAPAMIRLSGATATQFSPRVLDYVNAVADFVAKGGAIEVKAEPAEPLALSELQEVGATNPATLLDRIDLTVTHKE